MTRYWSVAALLIFLFLALFLAVEALGVPLLTDPLPSLEGGGLTAGLVGTALLVVDVLLPVPSSVVMIAHGALFGVLVGTLLSLGGSVGAALLAFGLGRRGGPLLTRLVPPGARGQSEALLRRWGPLAIALTRPVPLLAETVAVLAGASGLRWGQAALAAAVGALPSALLYALAGATAQQLSAAWVFGAVALTTAAFWLIGGWLGRVLTREAPPPR